MQGLVEAGERAVARAVEAIRALPPLVVDAVIALACYLATIASPIVDGQDTPYMYLFAALGSLPLIWRRRWPVLTTFITGGATVVLAMGDFLHEVPYGQLVATYTFASLASPRWRAIGIAATTAGVAVSLTPKSNLLPVGATVILFVVAYALGTERPGPPRPDRDAGGAGRRLAEEQEAAAARERERIAREMHDILAHSVSLMVVQAEAGPVAVRSDPDKAVAVFDTISATGREALAQLRRTLGVLAVGRARPGSRSPASTTCRALVAGVRRAGLAASLEEHGERRPVAAGSRRGRVPDRAGVADQHGQARRTRAASRYGWTGGTARWSWRCATTGGGPGRQRRPGGRGLVGMRERVRRPAATLTLRAGPGRRRVPGRGQLCPYGRGVPDRRDRSGCSSPTTRRWCAPASR